MKEVRQFLFLLGFSLVFNSNVTGQDSINKPSLFIGGGSLPEYMLVEFCKLIGPEAKLVVIPTATGLEVNEDRIRNRWLARGVQKVDVLHTRDREVASSDGFADPLKTATAVWISGGSQQRIADAYLNTPVEAELYNLIARGGIIGGSSAGAAIQSKVMISGGRAEPHLETGFDLLENAIIDQHFLKRNRWSRLINAIRANPKLVGFGIDEDTAIVIQGNQYQVVGDSYVMRVQMVDGKIQIDAFENGDTFTSTND